MTVMMFIQRITMLNNIVGAEVTQFIDLASPFVMLAFTRYMKRTVYCYHFYTFIGHHETSGLVLYIHFKNYILPLELDPRSHT